MSTYPLLYDTQLCQCLPSTHLPLQPSYCHPPFWHRGPVNPAGQVQDPSINEQTAPFSHAHTPIQPTPKVPIGQSAQQSTTTNCIWYRHSHACIMGSLSSNSFVVARHSCNHCAITASYMQQRAVRCHIHWFTFTRKLLHATPRVQFSPVVPAGQTHSKSTTPTTVQLAPP